jgi:hypothetical protein
VIVAECSWCASLPHSQTPRSKVAREWKFFFEYMQREWGGRPLAHRASN